MTYKGKNSFTSLSSDAINNSNKNSKTETRVKTTRVHQNEQ